MYKVEMIKEIASLAELECKNDSNVFGYEIWTHHISIVVKYAVMLAKKLDADREIVEIASLLHDYASIKDKSMYEEHHIYGAVEAESILRQYKYPEDRILRVKDCIMQHRGSVILERTSKESLCIASADAMAHIDQIPSLLHLAYFKRKMNVDEGAEWVMRKIERSWNKLCPEAKDIMKGKYESAKIIL